MEGCLPVIKFFYDEDVYYLVYDRSEGSGKNIPDSLHEGGYFVKQEIDGPTVQYPLHNAVLGMSKLAVAVMNNNFVVLNKLPTVTIPDERIDPTQET